ncbi:MAG: YopX family protein [Acutalibacteraceae bacterium]|jgi:uncharacterized phage protein (TIGR01671 family)|nr:MAG TPA: YopX protein [Caudoviricetes sp.]
MREILFRGKDFGVINHSWCFGSLDTTEDDRAIIIYPDRFGNKCRIIVDPKTVGQYTGLKDKNGTKIFEGDIVDVLYDVNYIGVATERIGVFEVVHNGCFMGQKGGVRYHFIPSDECTVIGNIYDNPELLGGK